MNRYLRDRGVQASIATGVTIAVVSAVAYSPALLAVGGVWAVVAAWSVAIARRRAHA